MRIAIAQLNPTVGDLDGNLERMVSAVHEAAGQGAAHFRHHHKTSL